MAQRTYKDELDRLNMEKTHNILIDLPEYVNDYFISRKSNTTTKTRLSYAYDLRNFFRYIVTYLNLPSAPTELTDVTIEDLGTIKAKAIEGFMEYFRQRYVIDVENVTYGELATLIDAYYDDNSPEVTEKLCAEMKEKAKRNGEIAVSLLRDEK